MRRRNVKWEGEAVSIPGSIIPKSMEPHNGSLVSSLGPHHMRPPVLKRPLGAYTQCITFHSALESHHHNPNTIKLQTRTNHQQNCTPDKTKRTGCDGAAATETHPANNHRHASSPPPSYDARQCCTPNNNDDDDSRQRQQNR
jgi:hypothetical protein